MISRWRAVLMPAEELKSRAQTGMLEREAPFAAASTRRRRSPRQGLPFQSAAISRPDETGCRNIRISPLGGALTPRDQAGYEAGSRRAGQGACVDAWRRRLRARSSARPAPRRPRAPAPAHKEHHLPQEAFECISIFAARLGPARRIRNGHRRASADLGLEHVRGTSVPRSGTGIIRDEPRLHAFLSENSSCYTPPGRCVLRSDTHRCTFTEHGATN